MKPSANSQLGYISGLPTSFLISPEGELVARNTGMMTAKMIEEYINHPNADDAEPAPAQAKQAAVEAQAEKQKSVSVPAQK